MVQGIGASKMDEDFFSKNALTYSRFSGWWRGRWKRGWRWWPRRRGGREDCEWVNFYFKAHSHELRLMPAAAAVGCVSTEIGIFLFLCTSHFCLSHTRQTQPHSQTATQPNTAKHIKHSLPEWAFTDMLQICWNLQEPIAANNWKLFLLFATQPSPLQQSLQLWLVWTRLKSHSSCGHCRWRIRPWSVWPDCCDLLKVLGNKKVLATLENCFGI